MKIGIIQAKAARGDIQSNIANHKKLIGPALLNGANIIIFPELSLTGYEPSLAKTLATTQDDSRFDEFQEICDTKQVTIGVGMPTKNDDGICISLVLFHPQQPRQTQSKKYIHPDEEPFFIPGHSTGLLINDPPIALAICYELSVPEHSENARKNGAGIYIASVAKRADGVRKAEATLSGIAAKYSIPVLMSNCVGQSEDGLCAGNSAAWNNKGMLLAQLDDTREGIIIFDMDTQEIIEQYSAKQTTG